MKPLNTLVPKCTAILCSVLFVLLTVESYSQCTAGWCYTQNGSLPTLTIGADVANNPQDSPCLNPNDDGGATQNCHEFVFDASSMLADPCPPPEVTFTPWQGCGNGVGNIEIFEDDCTCIAGSAAGTAWTVPVDPVTYIGSYIVCTTSNKMNIADVAFCRDFCWEPPVIEGNTDYGCPPGDGGAPLLPPAIPAAFLPGSGGDDEIATEALGAIIYDFHCSVIETEAVDTDNGGSGCYGDPYIVTRTYTIYSDGVAQGSFVETFTWEDPYGLCLTCIPETCEEAAAVPATICEILAADPGNPLETLDCDMGGIDNLTECNNAGDPDDPADDCSIAIAAGIDICALITADPTNPLATADCDGGGIDNATECANGGDPADPADDCAVAIAASVDICAIIAADPTSPLATADCDGGGVDNATECANGGDPADPADECTAAIAGGVDICALIAADPTIALATLDCDMGGVDNATECANGGDPADPADECTAAIAAGVDICALIAADPTIALATLDCDMGGVDNATECANGGDPADPADECTAAIAAGVDICALIAADPTIALATLDCDMGGVDNATECANGGDPADPADECTAAIAAGVDICALIAADPTIALATLDCDAGGVDNATECANGGDPADPDDECTAAIAAGVDICALIAADPTIALATLDCDMGGVDNATECANGGDPADPADECTAAIAAGVDICALIAADPTIALATLDCDMGGIDNATECANAGDPNDPADDCTIAIDAGIDICALIAADPTSPLATADCDGGGVDNATECANGGDPTDPADECTAAIAAGVDICAIIAADPTKAIATLDCDMGGVDNATECGAGNDPSDMIDDALLPIELISFTSKRKLDGIQLNWITASEVNNNKFVLERSNDGLNYRFIAEVKGAGNSTELMHYAFTDMDPHCGTAYYRIVQFDLNGDSSKSNPIVATFECRNEQSANVFPNPFREMINIAVNVSKRQDVNISIFDGTGKILMTKNILQVSESYIYTENMNAYNSQLYFVKVTYEDGSFEMHKLLQVK